MGSQIQTPQKAMLVQYAPPLQQYKVQYCGDNFYVWEHSLSNTSLIQFSNNIDNYLLKQHIDSFMYRHRHHLLVSAQYIRQNQSSNKISIFYERVFTNLSRIRDLPFQDSLQFYYVGLRGFEALYRRFGFFQIQDNMFHITKNSRVKIWCDKDISKTRPQPNRMNKENTKKREEEMVKKIIRLIDQNSDLAGNPFPIGSTLYKQASSSFLSAIQKLRQICNKEKFTIPEKLVCLDVIGKGEVGVLLDQYGQIRQNIVKFEAKQEEQTQNQIIKTNLQLFGMEIQNDKNQESNQHQNKENEDQGKAKPKKKSKGKGLKVTHSLQKLNEKVKDQVKDQGIQPCLFKQSPIKELQIAYVNTHSSTQPFYPIQKNMHTFVTPKKVSHQEANPIHLIKYTPQKNNIYIKQGPIIQSGQPVIRRNSVDYYKSPECHKLNGQQKIIINYQHRPTSGFFKPCPPTQKIQNKNNFSALPLTPNASRLKHEQNLRNIQKAYQRAEKTLTINKYSDEKMNNYSGKVQIPNQIARNYRFSGQKQNIIQRKFIPNYQDIDQFKLRANFIQVNKNYNDCKAPTGNYGSNQFKKGPINDYSTIKDRFQQYKKGFNYPNKQTKYDPKYHKQYNNPTTQTFTSQNYQPSNFTHNYTNNVDLNNLNPKPFFEGILKVNTVTSCMDSNGFSLQKQQSSVIKNDPLQINKLISKKYSNIPIIEEFPSNTDISDNASSVPTTKNVKGLNSQDITEKNNEAWRESSSVINHDPNGSSIKIPDKNQYMAKIDSDIWADMQKARERQKMTIIN